MKKLVQQKILYFQGFSATLFLRSRTICCKVFYQVTDNIAGRLKGGCGKRNTGCSLRIDAGCVIDKVSFHSAFLDFFHAQSFGQLVQDCADQLDMRQLFCTNIGQPCFDLSPWSSVTLA